MRLVTRPRLIRPLQWLVLFAAPVVGWQQWSVVGAVGGVVVAVIFSGVLFPTWRTDLTRSDVARVLRRIVPQSAPGCYLIVDIGRGHICAFGHTTRLADTTDSRVSVLVLALPSDRWPALAPQWSREGVLPDEVDRRGKGTWRHLPSWFLELTSPSAAMVLFDMLLAESGIRMEQVHARIYGASSRLWDPEANA